MVCGDLPAGESFLTGGHTDRYIGGHTDRYIGGHTKIHINEEIY